MLIQKKYVILVAILWLFACDKEYQKPRLLILISVDQLSYNTYTHYQPVFKGGFKWLRDHGVTFSNANHEHGYTSTGPGHFVIGSGIYPGPAGLLGNNWYDRESGKDVYCVADSDAQALSIPARSMSYGKVNGSTFGDWLKKGSSKSKVYSVACKDRAAILLGGKNPDLAIWYNWKGAFTTTDYYTEKIPSWLRDFNTRVNIKSYRDSVWNKSFDESVYAEYAHADSFYGESDRYFNEVYSPVFPIGFEANWEDQKIYSELGGRPWMDRMTLDLATTLIQAEKLGQDEIPDVLTIGLSAFDIIGHYYGHYSHEGMDHLLKLDQYLDTFFKHLDSQIGLENVIIVLTADHGGLPLPEHVTEIEGKSGGRVDEEVYLASRARAYTVIDSLYGNHDFIHRKVSSYYYNWPMLDSMDVNPATIDSILQTYMESVEGVYRLYTKAELLAADPTDPLAFRLSHFMHPTLSPDLYTLVDSGWIFRNPFGTTHSTPYEYDSHVPLIVSNLGFSQKTRSDSVATIDIAPTMGEILGVIPTHTVDGVSLWPKIVVAEQEF